MSAIGIKVMHLLLEKVTVAPVSSIDISSVSYVARAVFNQESEAESYGKNVYGHDGFRVEPIEFIR